MQILVTGGAGYIGSVVCEKLAEQEHTLIVVDDLRDGKKAALPPKCLFYQADFGDVQILESIFSAHPIDLVIHLAASANVPDSVINPLPYYQNNVSGTIALLAVMKKYDVKKILFSSTAAVYGEPQMIPITELQPLVPVNPYGFSKLFDEQIIRDCSSAYGLKYFIFRYFCAAGATPFHGESREHESHLIPVVLDQLLGKRESISVFGNDFDTRDGSGVRDFIHVADIAKAHLLAIEKMDTIDNQTLNLGTGKGYSVFEIIQETEMMTGKKLNFEIKNRRPGDPASLIAAYDLAYHTISWEPSFNLTDIIRSALNWRKEPLY